MQNHHRQFQRYNTLHLYSDQANLLWDPVEPRALSRTAKRLGLLKLYPVQYILTKDSIKQSKGIELRFHNTSRLYSDQANALMGIQQRLESSLSVGRVNIQMPLSRGTLRPKKRNRLFPVTVRKKLG